MPARETAAPPPPPPWDGVIGGVTVPPGTRARIELPVADLATGDSLALPVRVVRGRRPGPTLLVSAAIHGDEVNGVEICRRLLRSASIKRLRGSLIAVPVVNVFGFLASSRYLPDRRDLNRCFPGSETGSLASRLAHLFVHEVVAHASHCIDLHTGSAQRSNLPQIRVTEGDAKAIALARTFAAPVVLESPLREKSLRRTVTERGVPFLLYEAGEALRFDEWAIRTGLRGILRVMRALGMLPPPKKARALPPPQRCRDSHWVRAPGSGILRPKAPLGAVVEAGQALATIGGALGDEAEQAVVARRTGVVIGRSNAPFVNEGDALYHVAWDEADGGAPAAADLEDYQVDLGQPFLFGSEEN